VRDGPRRSFTRSRRLAPSRGRAGNGDDEARCGYPWRSEIEPFAGLRFHEHVGNEHGTGKYAGQHDRCERTREDS